MSELNTANFSPPLL